jgi:hypothetical protein
MAAEAPGPVNGEPGGRVAGQDVLLAHDRRQRPQYRDRKRFHLL